MSEMKEIYQQLNLMSKITFLIQLEKVKKTHTGHIVSITAKELLDHLKTNNQTNPDSNIQTIVHKCCCKEEKKRR